MTQAVLNDGRSLFAVNDLFIGQKTHISARYILKQGDQQEAQSSSGIIISTGAGSSGWHRSILAGAAGEMAAFASPKALEKARTHYRFEPRSFVSLPRTRALRNPDHSAAWCEAPLKQNRLWW